MKKLLLKIFSILALLLLNLSVKAQVVIIDNFEDASLINTPSSTTNPVWVGSTSSFPVANSPTITPIANSYSLTSNTGNSIQTIYNQYATNLGAVDRTWRFLFRNTGSSSGTLTANGPDNSAPKLGSANFRFWLAATDPSPSVAGGYALIYESGKLTLRRYTANNGGTTNIGSSFTVPLNSICSIRITRRASDGLWTFYANSGTTAEATSQVTSSNNTEVGITGSVYTILECNDNGASNKYVWDNYSITSAQLLISCITTGLSSNLYQGDANKAIVGFQLTAQDNSSLSNLQFTSSYGSINQNYFSGARLYSSSSPVFSTGTANQITGLSMNVNAGNINFNGPIAIANGSALYYYLVVDINSGAFGGNTASPPALTFTVSNSTMTASANSIINIPSTSCTSSSVTIGNIWDWVGLATDANWNTARNWRLNGNNPPGSSLTNPSIADKINFYVNYAYGAQQPTVNGTYTYSAINIGSLQQAVFTIATGNKLTLNDALNINTPYTINLNGAGSLDMGPKSVLTFTKPGAFASGALTLASTFTFTLKSDATGSAAIANIGKPGDFSGSTPFAGTGAGTIAVERFVTGGASINRGYRLFSSPVTSGSGLYSLAYLKNSSWLTGTTGTTGGFDKTGNPTIYFFRENMEPSQASFTGGNFRGVNSFPTAPYSFDDEAADYSIPVGNGFLFFFRGSRSAATLSAATTSSTVPTNTTFTATGAPNVGNVVVKPWYNSSASVLGFSTATANTAIRGYNLVGNPYASTINWEKYNRNATIANSSIYGSNSLPSTIYIYNTNTKNYASYQPSTVITATADTVSNIIPSNAVSSDGVVNNMIASGQGFFIVATTTTQALTFRENAKTTTLPLTTSIAKIMSLPSSRMAVGPQIETSNILDPVFRVKLAKDDINTDAVTFVLNNKNDTKFSFEEDALDIGGNGAQVSLSAKSSDNVLLSINRLPLPKLTPQILPLTVDATATGLYSLKMDLLENMPALYQVFLKDALKGDSLDMRAHDTYNFNIDKGNATTFGDKRFTLVIRQNPELALKLLDFNGAKVTAGVKLNWIAENEGNYTNYTVERSIDNGSTFDIVGGLHATGDGKYNITDTKPIKGLNRYRLKQDDINGTITYSKIVDIMYADIESVTIRAFNVYPNPVSNTVNVSIINPATTATTYTIKISDGSGSLVKNAVSTQSTWQANVGNLLPGTYFVQVVNNTTKAVIGNGKFVKL